MLLDYIKRKLARKKARKVFQEYDYEIQSFDLSTDGKVQFANWKNPLVPAFIITQADVDFFKQFIPKGSLAIDVGGNTGDTTVLMSLAAGKEGLVIGFDPNPYVFKILEANAGLNKDKTNIVVLPYAVTDKEGEFYYASSEASFANGGITDQPSAYHGSHKLSTTIKGINLEKHLDQHYPGWLSKISLIKVDVEGYDKEVIKSVHPILEKYRPVVIAECFFKLTPAEREDLFDSLASKNYDLFYFEDFKAGTETAPLSKADMTKRKHFNLYALPRK
ncbi:MAG TPA: FkbM family methyltransferase [Chitinophagaceae bacterium]